jgi:hypothetical protein
VGTEFRVPVDIHDLLHFVFALVFLELGTVDLFFAFPIDVNCLV